VKILYWFPGDLLHLVSDCISQSRSHPYYYFSTHCSSFFLVHYIAPKLSYFYRGQRRCFRTIIGRTVTNIDTLVQSQDHNTTYCPQKAAFKEITLRSHHFRSYILACFGLPTLRSRIQRAIRVLKDHQDTTNHSHFRIMESKQLIQ
jgi:hypothetical protein